jgi:hypothetical protein
LYICEICDKITAQISQRLPTISIILANGMQKLAFSGYSHKNLNAKKAPTNVDAQ